jgi:predicted Zn-dependent protease with MMP-like domain
MTQKHSRLSDKAFDEVVQQALARIPGEIRRHLSNILITVQQRPSAEMLEEMGLPAGEPLLGLFWGVPLTARSAIDPPLYPDTIYLFQEPLEQLCSTREELIEEIEITVVHEIAHFVGLSDEQLEALGYG